MPKRCERSLAFERFPHCKEQRPNITLFTLTNSQISEVGVGFGHADYGQSMAVAEGHFDLVEDTIAAREVERDAGESGSHFKAGETGGTCGGFAGCEDFGSDAATGKIGMDEEGAYFGGVGFGIEEFGLANVGVIRAKQRFAFAPAAAAGEMAGAGSPGFGDEVRAVGDELCVEAEDGAEGAFDLFACVVVALKDADGGFYKLVEGGDVGWRGEAEFDVQVRKHVRQRENDNAEGR